MSSEVFLTFTPRTAAALVTTLPLSTNTGVVHVRLECYPRCVDQWKGSTTVTHTVVWRNFVVWCTGGNTALWLA